jgi:hypothetical protein
MVLRDIRGLTVSGHYSHARSKAAGRRLHAINVVQAASYTRRSRHAFHSGEDKRSEVWCWSETGRRACQVWGLTIEKGILDSWLLAAASVSMLDFRLDDWYMAESHLPCDAGTAVIDVGGRVAEKAERAERASLAQVPDALCWCQLAFFPGASC